MQEITADISPASDIIEQSEATCRSISVLSSANAGIGDHDHDMSVSSQGCECECMTKDTIMCNSIFGMTSTDDSVNADTTAADDCVSSLLCIYCSRTARCRIVTLLVGGTQQLTRCHVDVTSGYVCF